MSKERSKRLSTCLQELARLQEEAYALLDVPDVPQGRLDWLWDDVGEALRRVGLIPCDRIPTTVSSAYYRICDTHRHVRTHFADALVLEASGMASLPFS